MKWLKFAGLCGGACGAVIALASVWHMMGGDTLAWASDLHKLNSRQIETAVDVYSRAISDDTITRAQITDPVTRALIDQRIKDASDKLKAAQDRKIDLTK